MIENFCISSQRNSVSWIYLGNKMQKKFSFEVRCLKLKYGDGVAAILDKQEMGCPVGYIFNEDGSKRFTFYAPKEYPNAIDFYDIRYDGENELRVIVSLENKEGWRDLACVIDPETGKYVRFFEVR